MTAVAGTIALEEHGLAAQHPFAVAVAIAAVGEVVWCLLSAGVHEGHVTAVPTSDADVAGEQPFAVGTPFKPQVAIAVGVVVFGIEHGTYLFAGEIQYAQGTAVLEEGHLLAVGRILGLQ